MRRNREVVDDVPTHIGFLMTRRQSNSWFSIPNQNPYQTLHFLAGFISDPIGKLKSLANSSELRKTPKTRKSCGE